ncbi:hypothetical protein LAUMK4_02026 [Mycobacterium persicum]|uniref:Uncharacterized protein n=1 Tax=Mycobacterium persicum TaxID=1487726 RepID=A0AB38USJ5_9MYCO|nr:hypothetical protein LAUMK15_02348 [Mycobacterium persicum]VAZ83386.1 hypothetical protein LAUMK42_02203 [Mycobacterium persicum]VAZ92204.1 hypothetical protein LAUMK4_02026 [Mycobacterium persicum]
MNGRPNNVWAGALMAPNKLCSNVCNGVTLAASAPAYAPLAAFNVWTKL